MITRIELDQVATYKNPVEINDLKKVNFFFGNNGSGKSTIARLFYEFSKADILAGPFAQCLIENFDRINETILVFDNEFIQRNFYINKDLDGIFSLDEKNEELEENIKNENEIILTTKNTILEKKENIQNVQNQRDQLKENILETCFQYNRKFKKDFNQIDLGGRREFFYQKLIEINQNTFTAKNISYLTEKYKKLYVEELIKIDNKLSLNTFEKITDLEITINELLNEIIVGSSDVSIAPLIEKINNSSWVEQGINFLDKEKINQKCPFCQESTITKDLLIQFEKYFDTTREEKLNKIKLAFSDYKSIVSTFDTELQNISNQKIVSSKVLKLQNIIQKISFDNQNEFQNKLDKPNERKKIKSINDLKQYVKEINSIINTHNLEVDNIKQNQSELKDDVFNYIADQVKNNILDYQTKDNVYKLEIEKSEKELKTLKDNIILSVEKVKDWQTKTVNTQDAVDQINNILIRNNFTGFRIEKNKTENKIDKYYISRDDSEPQDENIFKTLSEGEKNFIAFLYFYQLCLKTNDTEDSAKKKIIVIDDPVSSMGSQNLFFVSTLIRGLIANNKKGGGSANDFRDQNIEQVFLLTHNSYFYKEISFDKGGTYICKVNSHYLIRKDKNLSTISPKIKYDNVSFSEYERLWNELKHDNISNVSMLNCMRRILETYVNFIGLGKDIWNTLSEIDENGNNYWVYRSLLSMLHDGSHKINPNEEMYYQETDDSMRENIKSIFENLFTQIGKEHYNMMMQNS